MSKLGGKQVSENTDKDTLATGIVESVVAGTNVTVDNTDPANPIVTATDTGEANTASNVGAGAGKVFKQKTGDDLELKSIKAGTNITVTNNVSDVEIAADTAITTKGDILSFDTAENRLPVGTNTQVLTADSGEALGVKWAAVPGGFSDPLTTKGDVMGFDSATNRIPIGTDDQVLTADSAQALGLKWAAPATTDPLTTKGDLEVFDTDANRLPVGTNDQVLTADSAQTLGVKWADAAAGGQNTTKGDLEGFSTVAARIPIGTNGQHLEADSGEALGLKWATPATGSSTRTTKGDLEGFSTVDARIPVGTNDQVLTADSTEALGVKWATPAAGGGAPQGALLKRTTNLAGDGDVDITFPTEVYDDNSFGAGGTANRLTVPTGVTRVNVSANFQGTGGTANSLLQINIQRFSSADAFIETVCQVKIETTDTSPAMSCSYNGAECVATDYFKVRVFSSDLAWTITNASFSIQDVTP